ncbi:hypothetical protein HELRODRAFT_157153 [Helobdella robusta]|uniref:Uncharacterized protein n=1 Tax=Helobdella robusta TaxID=6412 RepID=T1EM71_HELRO|nr:hypothetical protein HELRODRAFT_157153 [Helobdella robusta]ESO03123.1 hypothetical protein HELRODRAFT_157153 [Helobdella robusta]
MWKLSGIAEHPYNDHFKLHHRICLNILKHFGFGQGVMEARIKAEVEDLLGRVDDKKDEAFDPSFEITAAVSNVISSIIFGRSWSKDDPNFHEGLDIIHSFLSDDTNSIMIDFFPVVRYLPYYNQCIKNYKNLRKRWDSYIGNVIDDALKSDVENFCNLYLKEANISKIDIMEEDQLKNTIRDLFLAGTETTATTLLWFIIIMANNQGVQKRVQNELDRVVGSNRLPCLEDKPNLPITEAFILEAMRFKTLVPMALVHLTTKETIIDGVLIPSGVMVMPNIYSAHMNSEDWVDPEIFKIERFLNDDQTQVVNRDLIIPFSLGKRACLGEILAKQEIFLFTTSILHKYSILPKKCDEKIVVEEIIGITVSPSPFEARLVKRN